MQVQSNTQSKFKNFAIAVFFFISPLVFLNYFLENQKNTELAQNYFHWQEQLTREMSDFYELLRPTTYIDNIFAEIQIKVKNHKSEPESPLAKMQKQHILPLNHLSEVENYLTNQRGIKPFLLAKKNLTKPAQIKTNLNIFKSNREKQQFAEGLLTNYLFPFNYAQTYSAAQSYIAKHLSLFAALPLIPGKSEQFFSGKFGNQLTYHIFNQYSLNRQEQEPHHGVDYFCFNATDINAESLLNHGLTTTKNTKIKREILDLPHKAKIKLPSFHKFNGRLYYLNNYPSDYLTYCRNQKVLHESLSKDLLDKASTSCIAVSVPNEALNSNYQSQLKLNQKITWLTFFALWFLFIKGLVHSTPLSFKLTNKLRLTVAISIIVPLIGVLFSYELIRNRAENLILSECQTKIARQFKLFEKICENNDLRLIIEAQKYKKHLADSFFGAPSRNRFYRSFRRTRQFPHSQAITETRLMDSAINLTRIDHIARVPAQFADSLSYYQLFRDLKLIDYQLADASLLAKQDMVMALTESYWQLVLTPKRLAAESMLDYDLNKLNSNRKVTYQLLAPKTAPQAVKALAINTLDSAQVHAELLFNLIYKNPEITRDITDKYHINYGLFSYNTNRQLRSFKNHLQFGSNLFNLAMKSGVNENFSFLVSQKLREKVIEASAFSSKFPLIFAAEARIFNNTQLLSDGLLFYMFVLSYIIISTILLSRTLANALIRPINTLSKFINFIKKNELETRVEVSTGDELESLGQSLNNMAQELANKEKMRRFVSEKLYASLGEKEGESTAKSQGVTILSSDIRGFTLISEKYPPEAIVSLLNDYITEMEAAIIGNGGAIEKIIGDAITASFYEDQDFEPSGVRAAKAAIQMRKSLEVFNKRRSGQNKFTIENGIGLASGEVMLGFIGESSSRREFILIGEPIERAEALESETPRGRFSKIFVDKKTQEMLSTGFKLSEALDEQETREIII
jgi:class 3 adenylate cyclase